MSNHWWCLSVVLLTINLIMFCHIECAHLLGGWSSSEDRNLQDQMFDIVRHQLFQRYNIRTNSIEILRLETQIVAGTNLRLLFRVDRRFQCEMTAFKPLPYTKQPMEITFFNCRKE